MDMRVCLLCCVVILLGCGSDAGPEAVPISALAEEYACLNEAEYFAASCVGFVGAMPETVPAWRVIVAHPDGDRHLKELLDHASVAGQLYGLAGLKITDPEEFAVRLRAYASRTDSVRVIAGCIIHSVPVSRLMADFEDGSVPEALEAMTCSN